MTPERWRRITEIFHAARQQPERAAFLEKACGEDEALLREVEALLREHSGAARLPDTDALKRLAEARHARTAENDFAGAGASRSVGWPASARTTATAVPAVLPVTSDHVAHESHSSLSRFGPLDDARFAPGHIFASRYRIVSRLGRGGMGEVYRAEDLKLGQPVAIKLLPFRVARGDELLRRFIAEVRLARGVTHPNVCRVYDIGQAEGWHYLSMEYVDGETLASLLQRIGRLPGEKALDMARQLCAGLAAAHERGVLHCDLKPLNIMVNGRGDIRIMDFGLAVLSGEPTGGEIAGTPGYMAPEQLAGDRATPQTDLYALGVVFYELFVGRKLFAVGTFDERGRVAQNPLPAGALLPGLDSVVDGIIHSCLEPDPANRPASALAVAAALPGGDPLAAALAEGRVPSPDMIAAAGRTGVLSPALAWGLLAGVLGGTLAIASQASVLSVRPSDVPKPPDVLAERARDLLAGAGAGEMQVDSEFWFAPDPFRAAPAEPSPPAALAASGARDDRRMPLKFVYRQSAQYLVPQNLFRFVTDVDPPMNAPGMATVTLDPQGRLLHFDRVPSEEARSRTSAATPDWDRLFGEAGLDPREFMPVATRGTPLVPHDSRLAWESRATASNPVRVTAATLDGAAVFFAVAGAGGAADVPRNPAPPFSTGRSPAGEAMLGGVLVLMFAGAALLARQNLRLGQGDRRGARKLAVFVVCDGALSAILRAHHAPRGLETLTFLLGVSGAALVWGAYTWLVYISLEPYVRRVWPNTLISWTRLLSGRWRDPLIGRDVVVGLLAGVIRTQLLIGRLWLADRASPDVLFTPALESLRSVRQFMNMAFAHQVLESLEYGLATLFLLFLIRVVVRKTWIAAGIVALLFVPLGFRGGAPLAGWELIWVIGSILFGLTILLRVGLLAYLVMLFFTGLLAVGTVTLDPGAWYFGTSVVTLLVVTALSVYGFLVSLGTRPAVGARAA